MSFIEEVGQQSNALKELVNYYTNSEGNKLLNKIPELISPKTTRSLIFIGMGTSCFAPLIIRDILVTKTKIVPSIWDAGEFLHYAINSVTNNDVVIAISQSGESIETKKCVERLKKRSRIISITNNSESSIAKYSELSLPILAGNEVSISNKTYTNTLAILLLLCNKIVGLPVTRLMTHFIKCADEMNNFFINRKDEIKGASKFLKSATYLHFIARGPVSVSAMQCSLTWMEGVGISATAFTGGSFRHGPFELTGRNHYAVCFIPEGHNGILIEKLVRDMSESGSKIVVFTAKKIRAESNIYSIEVSPGLERIFPITVAVPHELLLAYMAQDRGLVPGKFRKCSKITTVE
jgi:glucosamine--fructose-6-phosphate aminotransferase (isomerizing)